MTLLSLVVLLFAVSCGYQLFATWCSMRFASRRLGAKNPRLRFSLIKPVREADEDSLAQISRFLDKCGEGDYDIYLCSAASAPEQWLKEQPKITWLCLQAEQSRNGKASTLALAQRYWSGDIFVVSDADMGCCPEYLDAVLGEFSDPEVGVVTCLYRARPESGLGALVESLCIVDFCASVLVAEKTEGVGFAMGSTMAIRRETLEQIGGFEALEPYLADDYQLGYRARQKGWKVALAPTVLDTGLGQPSLGQALSHQYRWLVTSKVSRPAGHFAFVVTQGMFWAGFLAVIRPAWGGLALLFWCFLRWTAGFVQAQKLAPSHHQQRQWEWLLLPLKDLLYLGLWATSLTGNSVTWGDQTLHLDSEGRIVASASGD